MASSITTAEELKGLTTLKQMIGRCKMSDDAWQLFAEQLGDSGFDDTDLIDWKKAEATFGISNNAVKTAAPAKQLKDGGGLRSVNP